VQTTTHTTSAERLSRFVELCRQATAIVLAALAAGLVIGGVGSRVFMLIARLLAPERKRVITESGARIGEVTLGGSFFLILFVGVFIAIGIGVLMAVSHGVLERVGAWEGPIVGWLVLALFSPAVIDPDNFDFAVLGDQAITIAMIAALGMAAGWVAVAMRDRLLRRLPPRPDIRGEGSAYLPAFVLGAIGVVLIIGLMGATDEPGGVTLVDIVVGTSFGVLLLTVITDRALWVARDRTPRLLHHIATVSLIGVGIAGTIRLVSDVRAILP
jgi:hypothetical protein